MITLKIHWLSITLWTTEKQGREVYSAFLEEYLGALVGVGHGGPGFRQIDKALAGCTFLYNPVSNDEYVHFVLPGTACDSIPDEALRAFMFFVFANCGARVSRLDLAFDGVPLSPLEVAGAVEVGNFRSLAKRETLVVWRSPFEKAGDGRIGTSSMSVGSRMSERMIRVYDMRGPTRVEFQCRDARADLIAGDLSVVSDVGEWYRVAVEHLLDYVDFELKGWKAISQNYLRANKLVTEASELEVDRITTWLLKSVAPAYSVIVELNGLEFAEAMAKWGTNHRNGKYKALLTKRTLARAAAAVS